MVVALVLGGAVAGCGDSIDAGDLEADLAGQTARDAGVPEESVDVDCPEDLDAEAGLTFDCATTIEGNETTIEVEVLDDEGSYTRRFK